MGQPITNYGYYNPVPVIALNQFSTETDRLIANVYGSVEPVKGLILKTSFGMDNLTSEYNEFDTPVTGDGYGTNGYTEGYLEKFRRWTWTNTANYNLTLKDLYNVGLLSGVEEQRTTDISWYGQATNVADPFFKVYQGSWVTPGTTGGGIGEN